jgi:amino acid transporter
MATSTAQSSTRGFKRVMRRVDMILFTVCAIVVIDQLAASAAIGPSSIFWWVFTLVFFFIPYGLIAAELGATYPEEGGIYAWVRRAYGPRWGARASWLYWINVALWMPSVYVLFAGMLAQLFFPEMGLWTKILIGLAMTWLTTYINVIALDVGKWVPNIGAFIKGAIMLTIGFAGFAYATRHGVANELSLKSITPTWSSSLAFLPVIVYNFLGFELMSGASEEMKNPARDVLTSIVVAGIFIATFYLLGTIGILIALPVEKIGLIEGILDTLNKLFADYAWGPTFVTALGLGALYTFLANMTTWTIGANRSASEAAERGDLPRILGKLHPTHKTPMSAAIITGVVSSVVMVLYGFMASTAEDLFWTLYAFSSIVFLLPYLLMFGAFVRLRARDAAITRPYAVPGGRGTACVLATLCGLFIVQAIVFFVYTPGGTDWKKAGSIIAGVLITLIVGEVLIARSGRHGAPAERPVV